MTDVKPKPLPNAGKEAKLGEMPPVRKNFLYYSGKVLDGLEWDARRGVMSMLIGMILVLGVANLAIYMWQYWVFLIGMLLIAIPMFMRGQLFGGAAERKLHDAIFMCIPKDVLMKQAEMQKLMHEAHHKEKTDDEDKMPN